MKDQEVKRQNDLSDPDLIADCRRRISQARTDKADLAGEGVTDPFLDTFEQEVDGFEKLPDDAALLYAQQEKRALRDAALEAARTVIRDVTNPIRRAYGERSPQLKRFGAEDLADLSPAEVLNILIDAQETGQAFLTDDKAKAEGFGQARLDALQPAYVALKEAQKNFKDAEQARLEGTRARVLAYNSLDDKAATLCARGYDFYVERNATKASAYVRDPAPGPVATPTPPPSV